jgi:hypothetical protein
MSFDTPELRGRDLRAVTSSTLTCAVHTERLCDPPVNGDRSRGVTNAISAGVTQSASVPENARDHARADTSRKK